MDEIKMIKSDEHFHLHKGAPKAVSSTAAGRWTHGRTFMGGG